ncbi:hypothetical protein SDRG_11563 [Saprolegnia diclina VS20]|uniref:Hexose transporter 1 n=1 Tax=Saprolegnia diclina (strain VS20) TaxID=1156394 RepID=T0RLF5_SAPDV|nr:hypothetical protein SDRG_11563 [Saprolegnia diclina VS20]EQC30802.1 hypothetical protein SDRG_11563 [Saprolegnia diclina VS20]|eukprot:XP_008615826.1 hypothetical protein SDRG_11563 [Saprolegnia diclina VS20]
MTVSETLGQLFHYRYWRSSPPPSSVQHPSKSDDDDDDDEAYDVYVAADTPVSLAPMSMTPPAASHGPSWRRHRAKTARYHLSKLESMVHDEHADAMRPSSVFYATIGIALLSAFQFGWLLSQLNYVPFNANCGASPIPAGDCLLFPPHSENKWTLAVAAWIAGGAVGAICSGLPADIFGRKKTLGVNALIIVFGGLIQSLATTLETFTVGRLVSGVASGVAINVCEALISEISPSQMRGTFLTGLQVGVAFGSLAVTTAHYALDDSELRWRLLMGVPVVLGGLQLLSLRVMAQSPVWLVAHDRLDDAKAEMTRLYQTMDVDTILHALAAAHADEATELNGRNPRALLFSAPFRQQLIIAIVLCAAQQLCGIPAIMYYSSNIFAGAGIADPRVGNTVVNVVRTSTICVAAAVMDKYPRRTLLLRGMSLQALAAVGLVASLVCGSALGAIVATGVFVVGFCLSIGPMAWTVSSEIFPDYMQATAGSLGTMSTWLGDLLVGLLYPTLAQGNALGSYAFSIFAALLVGFVLFVYVYVPETNGRTAVEIQAAFDHDAPPPSGQNHSGDPWGTELRTLVA